MIILFGVFLILLVVGVPVFVALAAGSLAYIKLETFIPDFVVLHRMAGGVDSFPLLAVPFFILAGNLMNTAGITNRIFDFAVSAVGWMRGGLGHVNVVGSVIFAGMSGTAVADAGGLGNIEIKAMRDHGYKDEFAIGITAASSTIGPIIPPSLPMVVFGVVGNVSIGQLFAGGLIPGVLMAVVMMFYVTWYSRRHNIGRDQMFRMKALLTSFVRAIPALFTPILIIGGMSFGVFTPTEAAIAACAWALLLGVLLYRSLSLKQFYRITLDTIEMTASVLVIVGAASLFGWVLTTTRVTETIATSILSVTDNPLLIMLLLNVFLLLVGCFMETIAAISILVPILMPIIIHVGIDPVQFGVVMVLNLMIGLLTPPVGMVLFVLSRVARVSLDRTIVGVTPFLIPLLIVLVLISVFPWFTTALPTLWYR
ncbi:TRAP transporter large permease [Phreatobacter sp. HK31-P]